MTEQDESPDFPWRRLADLAFAVAIAIGGWAWTSTTSELVELRTSMASRNERLASLESRVSADDATIARLYDELRTLNGKMDQLLYRRPIGDADVPLFQRGKQFDK